MTRSDLEPGSVPDSEPRGISCGEFRDQLPTRIRSGTGIGRVDSIGAHLEGCADCRAHADLVSRLQVARRSPPEDLLPAILARIPQRPVADAEILPARTGTEAGAHGARPAVQRPPFRLRWAWALPAAAGVVLAIAIGTLSNGPYAPEAIWSLALEPEAPLHWYGDDWVVAGEPYLDALPDEVLRALLEEMDP